MSGPLIIDMGFPPLLEFRGPDAIRFLNGQLTQDVRRLAGGEISLPSCVTDAKGKLQFRVHITAKETDVLWVSEAGGSSEALEARLTRYLIADDVEVADLTGSYHLYHLIGKDVAPSGNAIVRKASRYGVEGLDVWLPAAERMDETGTREELEALRISKGSPAWRAELTEGMLPPEAGLDKTDISYHKGCYIGQEVISRIKSAGKVNRSLVRMRIAEDADVKPGDALVSGGLNAGSVTSVSPVASGGFREALGYLKRMADPADVAVTTEAGSFPVSVLS